MPPNNVPDLGRLLRDWRTRQGQTHEQWGVAIFVGGFQQWGDPNTIRAAHEIAAGLAAIEATDDWAFGMLEIEALPPFCDACKAVLVHDSQDQADFIALVVLLQGHVFPIWGIFFFP